jgi:hypothetical protein
MTDFRALCAELLQPLAEYDGANPCHEHRDLITRARAALDKPEKGGPSDQDLWGLWDEVAGYFALYDEALRFGRAVLARFALAVVPVATSEQPLEEGYCDAEGQCWRFHPESDSRWSNWSYSRSNGQETHTLPHNAIPLPHAVESQP